MPLFPCVALLPQKVSNVKDTAVNSLANNSLLPNLAQLSQSTIGDLVQFQQILTGCLSASGLPAATSAQPKEPELGSKVVIIPPNTTPLSSSHLPPPDPSKEIEQMEGKAGDKSRHQSTSEPKTKRRKRSKHLGTKSKSDDGDGLAKLTPKDDSAEASRDSVKRVKEPKRSQRSKEREVKAEVQMKKKQAFVEPWKVDHTQDKRKFLGVIWKHGSTPLDKVVVSEESASLLVEDDFPEITTTMPLSAVKQQKALKLEKNKQKTKLTASSLPELSAKDVVDVANSPGVSSSVDASCLSLTSLSDHGSATEGSVVQHSCPDQQLCEPDAQNSNSSSEKPEKTTKHVRVLNFGAAGVSRGASDAPAANTSFGPSMPSSFDVFLENSQGRRRIPKKLADSRRSALTPGIQMLPGKREEREVAKTLISLATQPVFSQKDEAVVATSKCDTVQNQEVTANQEVKDLCTPRKLLAGKVVSDEGLSNGSVSSRKQTSQSDGKLAVKSNILNKKCLPLETSTQKAKEMSIKTIEKGVKRCSYQHRIQPVNISESRSNNLKDGCFVSPDTSLIQNKECQNSVSMRVATKPASMEKSKVEKNKAIEVKPGNQSGEDTQKYSSEPIREDSKTSLNYEPSKNSERRLSGQQSCSRSSPPSIENTPIKCEKLQLLASEVCSPKRTHVLRKLLEQGMKMKSPRVKKACKRLADNNMATKGFKVSSVCMCCVFLCVEYLKC